MFSGCLDGLKGKKLGLFAPTAGATASGAQLGGPAGRPARAGVAGVICNEAPDAEAEAGCEALGKALA
jgi:hypothetical protein